MKKKILFVNNTPVHNKTAGGILFDKLVRSYGIENFCFLSVENIINSEDVPYEYLDRPFKQFSFRLPKENIFFKIIKKLPFIEPIYVNIKYHFLKSKIIEFAAQQNCDLIFAPLRGDVLLILNDLLKSLKVSFVGMIEDTVEGEIMDHRILYKQKYKKYYNLIPQTKRLLVIGETMQSYIKTNFNIDSTILRLPFKKEAGEKLKEIKETLNFFFAGNLYARKEMYSFLEALDLYALSNKRLDINFYIASHYKVRYKPKAFKLINLGWIDQKKLVSFMEKCHVSYLPYKSEKKFMHAMKHAFPSKAGLYISFNLPIFFHGPTYSSFNKFLKIYNVGVTCPSFNSDEIILMLNKLIDDGNFYNFCQKECIRAYDKEFSEETFQSRVLNAFLDN